MKAVLRRNSRSFRFFNLFDVHFSSKFSYFSVFWDGFERFFNGFCMVILVFFGSTSSMFIFRVNSRNCRWSGMVWRGFRMVFLVLFNSSTSSMCIFVGHSLPFCWVWDGLERVSHGNSRIFWVFNFFDVHFSCQLLYFPVLYLKTLHLWW